MFPTPYGDDGYANRVREKSQITVMPRVFVGNGLKIRVLRGLYQIDAARYH